MLALLDEFKRAITRTMTNVKPSHLADPTLYDFKGLSTAQAGDEDPLFGDIDQEQALSLNSREGSRIGFVRNLG